MVELPRGQDEDVGDGGDEDDSGGDGESGASGRGKGKEKAKARRFTAVSGGIGLYIAWDADSAGVGAVPPLCTCLWSWCVSCLPVYLSACPSIFSACVVVVMWVVCACVSSTPQEEIRLALGVHKVHLACLVARCAMVSRWAGDPIVQAAMVSCLPSHLLSKVRLCVYVRGTHIF